MGTSKISYKDLKNPPFSEKVFDSLVESVINKSFSNVHVTLVSFRGAGKPFEVRYLLNNYVPLSMKQHGRLYIWLDFNAFEIDASSSLKSSLNSLTTFICNSLSTDVRKLYEDLLSLEELQIGDYLSFLQYLILQENYSITLVFENFSVALEPEPYKEALTFLNELRTLHHSHMSFINLVDCEYDEKALSNLLGYRNVFESNIVWGSTTLFDVACIKQAFDNQSKVSSVSFTSVFINKVCKYAFGDPTVTKKIIMSAINDANFLKLFSEYTEIEDLYKLIGEDWFNQRYYELFSNLSIDSCTKVQSKDFKDLGEFILNTGLVIDVNNEFHLLNPFLKYYAQTYLKTTISQFKKDSQLHSHPREYLTGQELIAFSLFQKHVDEIVSRELLAELIWGEDWEEKYSEWSIDKLVSNIRKKLSKHNYPKKLTSIKGRGIMLS